MTGRVGRRVDDELSSNEVLASRKVKNFLDTLLASFPELRQIVNGEITPIELRKESMLGYGTIYRVLAGVYYELKRADEGKSPFSESEIREVLKKLGPKLREIPIAEDNEFWLKSGAFLVGGNAPQSTQGALRGLTNDLVEWAHNARATLAEAA